MPMPPPAQAASRLVIVLWAASPEQPDLTGAPFVYALAACALELEVDMHFTASCVKWLVPGTADTAFTDRARTKTVLDWLRETKAAGVRHFACSMAWAEHAPGATPIAEATGFAGAATVVVAAAQPDTRVMVF